MIYFITISPHYKSNNPPEIVYTTDSKKDMLAKARQLVLMKDSETRTMVDCWSGKEWHNIGAVIQTGERTAYLAYSKRDAKGHLIGEQYKKVNSDGTLSASVSKQGIRQADLILKHWL